MGCNERRHRRDGTGRSAIRLAFSDGIRDCSECSWAVLWNREELACRPRFLSAKDRFLIFIHSVGKVYQPLVIFF